MSPGVSVEQSPRSRQVDVTVSSLHEQPLAITTPASPTSATKAARPRLRLRRAPNVASAPSAAAASARPHGQAAPRFPAGAPGSGSALGGRASSSSVAAAAGVPGSGRAGAGAGSAAGAGAVLNEANTPRNTSEPET